MPGRLVLNLTPEQARELEWARDHHSLPYIRERAAGLLKIHEKQSGRQVALNGLLKPHAPDTIYAWVKRYKAGGLEALLVRPGRGRKPSFSPSAAKR